MSIWSNQRTHKSLGSHIYRAEIKPAQNPKWHPLKAQYWISPSCLAKQLLSYLCTAKIHLQCWEQINCTLLQDQGAQIQPQPEDSLQIKNLLLKVTEKTKVIFCDCDFYTSAFVSSFYPLLFLIIPSSCLRLKSKQEAGSKYYQCLKSEQLQKGTSRVWTPDLC